MTDQQKLLQNKINQSAKGPVFESGPGWGAKIKTWLGKYFYKVILPIIIVFLVGYGIIYRDRSELNDDNFPLETQSPQYLEGNISQVIVKGDGKINIARKAITQYFSSHPEEPATLAQKMYLETVLAKTIDSDLIVGNTVTFYEADIQAEFANAKTLTASQIQKWEAYARKAGIK